MDRDTQAARNDQNQTQDRMGPKEESEAIKHRARPVHIPLTGGAKSKIHRRVQGIEH